MTIRQGNSKGSDLERHSLPNHGDAMAMVSQRHANAARPADRGRYVRISERRAAAVDLKILLRRATSDCELEKLVAILAELIAQIDDARRIVSADAETISQLFARLTAVLTDRLSGIPLARQHSTSR